MAGFGQARIHFGLDEPREEGAWDCAISMANPGFRKDGPTS